MKIESPIIQLLDLKEFLKTDENTYKAFKQLVRMVNKKNVEDIQDTEITILTSMTRNHCLDDMERCQQYIVENYFMVERTSPILKTRRTRGLGL